MSHRSINRSISFIPFQADTHKRANQENTWSETGYLLQAFLQVRNSSSLNNRKECVIGKFDPSFMNGCFKNPRLLNF